MITEDAVHEILSQYKRFGWQLERIVLSPGLRANLSAAAKDLFGDKPIVDSDLNAAWFSRLNANGRVAWELRSLDPTPFALVDSAELNASQSDLNDLFQRLENQMRQRIIRPYEK